MKDLMRKKFVNPSLVINSNDEVHQLDQSLVIPPAMPNLLQDNIQKSEDDVASISCSQPHVKIQNHQLLLLLNMRAKVMPMMLNSWKVRVLLMC